MVPTMKIDDEIIKRALCLYMYNYDDAYINQVVSQMRIEQTRHDEYIRMDLGMKKETKWNQ